MEQKLSWFKVDARNKNELMEDLADCFLYQRELTAPDTLNGRSRLRPARAG